MVVVLGQKAEKREPCRLRRLGSQLDTGMGEGSRLGPGAESLTHAQQTLTDTSRQPKGQVYCRERCWSREWSCEEEERRVARWREQRFCLGGGAR